MTSTAEVPIRKIVLVLILLLVSGLAWSQGGRNRRFGGGGGGGFGNFFDGGDDAIGYDENIPPAEFRMARVKYATRNRAGSHGISQPMWAVDYPYAEEHLFAALRRVTNIDVAQDSIHLELTDNRIFDYPFLFLQQPGGGNWRPTAEEAANLREHLTRGGFLLIDDLQGDYDWATLEAALRRVFPDKKIIEIPDDDPLMHIFYDLDKNNPIPGDRHLRYSRGGEVVVQLPGPSQWRAIYDADGRILVAINFNQDMGDAWEHADDPNYPGPMTALAYKFGINYIVYAMTH